MPRIIAISDTHSRHSLMAPLPEGDILIHAGDATVRGDLAEIEEFNRWLGTLSFKHRVLIAGNHDWLFERSPALSRSLITNAIYLQDEPLVIEGLKFYGSPWQPRFFNWAFNLDRGEPLRRRWQMIPDETEVLVTHGPPHGVLDRVERNGAPESTGCRDLRMRVEAIRPRLHIFGHIHSGYGRLENEGTVFVNASICDERYQPVNLPIVIDL